MTERFHIIVEGLADLVFFEQYYRHLFGKSAPEGFIFKTDGKDNLNKFANKMRSMSANGGVNLVIFDADECFLYAEVLMVLSKDLDRFFFILIHKE